MTDITCSIEGCDAKPRRRDMCGKHYNRMLKARPPRRVEVWRACSVDGCWRPVQSRGYCGAHYHRWQRGTPIDATPVAEYGRTGCRVENCEAPHFGKGYCQTHLYRLRENGDPLAIRPPGFVSGAAPRGEAAAAWRGGSGAYSAVHHRVRRLHGDASSHSCVDCGSPAQHWSYRHGAPDEMLDEKGRPYSNDPDWYEPRCVRCHYAYDRAVG